MNKQKKKLKIKEEYNNNIDLYNKIKKPRGYIIIPDSLAWYDGITFTDAIIYGVLYQFAKMYRNKKDSMIGKGTLANNETIAQRANCSVATVKRALARLEELGIISTSKNKKSHRIIIIERDFLQPQPEEEKWIEKADKSWYGEMQKIIDADKEDCNFF